MPATTAADFQDRATLERLADEFGETNCCYDNGRWHISDLSGFSEAVAREPNRVKSRIAKGFYDALELLGGKSDILSLAGSYSDTLSDEDVASMLEEWVAGERADRAKAVSQ